MKNALNDIKDGIAKSIKRTKDNFVKTFKSKEDFMGVVQSLSEKYSIFKVGDRIAEVLANINDRLFGI